MRETARSIGINKAGTREAGFRALWDVHTVRERGEGRNRSFSVVGERLQRRSRALGDEPRDLGDLEGLMTVDGKE